MFRQYTTKDCDKARALLLRVSTSAVSCFEEGIQTNTLAQAVCFESETNKGIYIYKHGEGFCIGYSSFCNDEIGDADLAELNRLIKLAVAEAHGVELCMNANADNAKVVALIHANGFREDAPGSPGYEILYDRIWDENGNDYPCAVDLTGGLECFGYEPELIEEYLQLLEAAFAPLHQDIGQNAPVFTSARDNFRTMFENVNSLGGFAAFKQHGRLEGLYTVDFHGSMYVLTFLATAPEQQGRGLGAQMIDYCKAVTMKRMQADRLYLYVVEKNTGAQRFYRANGFRQISHYSENTYQPN